MEIIKNFINNLNTSQLLFITLGVLVLCIITCIIMEKKEKYNTGVVVILFFITIALGFLTLMHEDSYKNTSIKHSKNDSITYHFIEEHYINKEQPYIRLINDKNNDVDMFYEIYDKNDKLLYTSSKISPGAIFYWKAYDYLKEGPTKLNIKTYYYNNKKGKNNEKPIYYNVEETIYKDYDPFHDYNAQY